MLMEPKNDSELSARRAKSVIEATLRAQPGNPTINARIEDPVSQNR
jgi:hypothetical protein